MTKETRVRASFILLLGALSTITLSAILWDPYVAGAGLLWWFSAAMVHP